MKYSIIAPHPDDDLIGCYRQIINGNVHDIVYVEKVSDERKEEAIKLCTDYKIAYSFLDGDVSWLYKCVGLNFLIPSPCDEHPLHKLVYYTMSRLYKNISVYSTYMKGDWFVKELKVPIAKRDALNKYYPSQKSLWETDWKYFLFEGLVHLENS